jgi:hypothetical protein
MKNTALLQKAVRKINGGLRSPAQQFYTAPHLQISRALSFVHNKNSDNIGGTVHGKVASAQSGEKNGKRQAVRSFLSIAALTLGGPALASASAGKASSMRLVR